tara:strand:- start:11990 stop:12424 length:435 start_codon:yes stop_codon:yes gene_type:complete
MPSRTNRPSRSRLLVFLAILASIALGLASRSSLIQHPILVAHAGDLLWAMMVYFGFAFLVPGTRPTALLLLAASFCLVIELSQLSSHPFLVSARQNRLGALILGRGFLWVDLARYSAGILMATTLDWLWFWRHATKRNSRARTS